MKYIWLMGGFGNVLFQVFAGKVIHDKYNVDIKYIDLLTNKNFITKSLKWTIHESMYLSLISSSKFYEIGKPYATLLVLLAFFSKKFKYHTKIVTFYNQSDRNTDFMSKNIFGYFQEKEFLSAYRDELLDFASEIRTTYSCKKLPVVVHYRYGDSSWTKEHEEYYYKIKELIKNENESVYIATDNPKRALDFFSDCNNVKLTDAKSAMDDFKYMINAQKLYVSPSTFSWWAAHGMSPESKQVFPAFFEKQLGIYREQTNYTIVRY